MRKLGSICMLLLGLCVLAAPAQGAFDDPLFVFTPKPPPVIPGQPPPPPEPPPTGYFDGPCGLAVDATGRLYVSDYYHGAVDVFTPPDPPYSAPPSYAAQLASIDPLNGPCGLAVDGLGNLLVNVYHQSVAKFGPIPFFAPGPVFDTEDPTGVAADPATGTVYVNNRTHISVYGPSGAPVLDGGGQPLRIGVGSLQDGYGLAISRFGATFGYLYVADAATGTVKAYDPAIDPDNPVQTIAGPPAKGFVSLRDAALALDWQNGELYVADDNQPAHTERPEATIHVFDVAGTYEGHLKHNVVDARPPGLAVDNSGGINQGNVYVTSGNTSPASIYAYPPEAATESNPLPPVDGSGAASASAGAPPGTAAVSSETATSSVPRQRSGARASVIAQRGNLRVSVSGKLSPKRLPREGAAPISVSVGSEISTTDATLPPQLESLRIEINRHGRLDYDGLPACPYSRIQPGSTSRALAACRPALVGRGSFTANIVLSGQEPYATKGRLLVFNGLKGRKPVLYGHIYSPRPFATSFVIVFAVKRLTRGAYGTALEAPLPKAMKAWGRLTGIEMTLSRRYRHEGERRSYLSAGCPAPKGFRGATFSLARASFAFEGGKRLSSVLSGSCKVRK